MKFGTTRFIKIDCYHDLSSSGFTIKPKVYGPSLRSAVYRRPRWTASSKMTSSKVRIQCISGWDTLENAFLPSNSPQIELLTILSPSSCLKVEKNNFSHQKMTFFDHSICNIFFKVHLRSNLSRNLTYLRQIWVLFNKTISKIFGRSPQKLVAVHPRSSWPFTP